MKIAVYVLIALVAIGGGIFIYQQHESLALAQQQAAQAQQTQQEIQEKLAQRPLPVELRAFRFPFSLFVSEQLVNHSGQTLDCTVTFIHNAVGTRNSRHLTLNPYGHSLRFTGFRVGDQVVIKSQGYARMDYTVLGR